MIALLVVDELTPRPRKRRCADDAPPAHRTTGARGVMCQMMGRTAYNTADRDHTRRGGRHLQLGPLLLLGGDDVAERDEGQHVHAEQDRRQAQHVGLLRHVRGEVERLDDLLARRHRAEAARLAGRARGLCNKLVLVARDDQPRELVQAVGLQRTASPSVTGGAGALGVLQQAL